MTQEDKQLLITDLSARLPYGVICKTPKGNGHLCSINQHIFGIEYGINIKATERDYFNDEEEIKPYLRPMSSMTEEEQREYNKTYWDTQTWENIDWLNKKMFDFRGLIPKGLALSTEAFNPY